MRIVLFFVLWLTFGLGSPTIAHVLFSSTEYPLVSLVTVVGFFGGALLAALLTAFSRTIRRLAHSKYRMELLPQPAARRRNLQQLKGLRSSNSSIGVPLVATMNLKNEVCRPPLARRFFSMREHNDDKRD